MRLRFTRSARKHGVSRDQIRHIIAHCGLVGRQPATATASVVAADRLIFLGDDTAGIALEVIAVELASGELLVIHAMPLREKYRTQYEDAKRWRK